MSDLRDFSDRELIELLAKDDRSAFEEIYFRYSPVIYKTAVRFFKNKRRGSDLVQEIFTKIWTDRTKFQKVENFKAYITIISKNLAIRQLKKIAQERLAQEEWSYRIQRSENSTELYINKIGLEKLLSEAILLLPPQQKKVYQLAKIEGLTYKAISDELNISTVTVKKHMIAANRFVRERISENV
ncbi:RNA polymerase sigma factor [Membranihabitans maritimus]|uniref:RNA polymerase sigma factor n=1 Tax=Membranihabitans maritimus TaxID=2904244 RepID=UPI001F02D995|nr:sigma-70 family RNA polymerase sigma factor [Membranihabitans maritimus]